MEPLGQDSSIGIHNGFTYADQLGVLVRCKNRRGFMGPPLETSFAVSQHVKLSWLSNFIVSYYKEREFTKPQLSSRSWLNIPTLYHYDEEHNRKLIWLAILGIDRFFDGIYGSSPQAAQGRCYPSSTDNS